MKQLLVYYAVKYQGDYNKIKKAILTHEHVSDASITSCLSRLTSSYVTILDESYPVRLRHLDDPPFVLFYHGDLSLASKPCVAMVGMRHPSDYGSLMAQRIATYLSSRYVIVSGLALGIDGISHTYAKKTVAVLGCGINYCYPPIHKQLYENIKRYGLIISEYPENVKPERYYFPFRNRMIAALSQGVVVVEAKRKSGSMITVSHALKLGLPIACVPHAVGENDGCNYLIGEGARIICQLEDIEDEFRV